MTPLAHGIGGVRDLPVPDSFFFAGAAIVLVVSFFALGVLWQKPELEKRSGGSLLSRALDRVLLSRALRVLVQAVSVLLLVVTLWAALWGSPIPLENFAPTFILVIFWLGVPLLSVLLGNVWSVLSPWRAIADVSVWLLERGGREARPLFDYPERVGRYPAAVAFFAFVALELAHPRPADPRVLGVAVALYTYWALAGMAVYGREPWTQRGEGFAVAFGLLARMAPFTVRDERIALRWPFTGLAGADRIPGTLAVVAVMLGSTSFDGFSRTTIWQDFLSEVREGLVDASRWRVDLTISLVNLAGLLIIVLAVALAYLAAMGVAGRLVRRTARSLVPEFLLSLVPIAFAYLLAHYFSQFLIQGQFAIPLASDPLGRGWDLLGTAGYDVNLVIVSPETVWYVQWFGLVVGHVAGLAIAHDRAVALFPSRKRRSTLSGPDARADGAVHGGWPVVAEPGLTGALLAHGGLAGAIAEATIALAVVAVFAGIWFRERSARRADDEAADEVRPGPE